MRSISRKRPNSILGILVLLDLVPTETDNQVPQENLSSIWCSKTQVHHRELFEVKSAQKKKKNSNKTIKECCIISSNFPEHITRLQAASVHQRNDFRSEKRQILVSFHYKRREKGLILKF